MKSLRTASKQGKGVKLPQTSWTKEKQQFCPGDDVWRLYDGGVSRTLTFERCRSCCHSELVQSLKAYLVYLLRFQSLDACNNFLERFLKLAKHCSLLAGGPVATITVDGVISYRATLDRDHEYLLHAIRARVEDWVQLGYPGIDPDVPEMLRKLKLKKNDSGVAVRTHHPVKGPFNDEEYHAIIQYLLDTFAAGQIDLFDLALGFLFVVFGPRPVSFAALRIKDFSVEKDSYGIDCYTLRIPAAKRRSGGRRTHLNVRKLSEEFGQMLSGLVPMVQKRFAKEIAAGLDLQELPFFPGKDASRGYCVSSSEISEQIERCFNAGVPIICNRRGLQGTVLHVNPRRFRITLGTRMAESGKREREIAEALGQTSMVSSRVYIEATGKLRHVINEKVMPLVEPFSKYFLGTIVQSEADAFRGDDPSSRIRSFDGSLKGRAVGTCGKSGFCGGFVPLPCYSCRKFQPWADAPHAELLAWLVQERQQKLAATGDETYASVNDEVIKKVADVVLRCSMLQGRKNAPKELPR
ncbi:site-specific integrase [Geomonas propionica]|uniref:Site-specific integrase n=1 Tax=Geomonas propionica TaxID=2798582 RepID=A0ABS0YRA0_9BACT|nr:site-specific integrase [Geomonas propionica]MBJ6800436.1 site-specific integrase [Geomonas propionica]